MSFTETLKNLLIPRKTQDPVAQPNYGTDMRAIENWVSGDLMGFLNDLVAFVNDISPSGGGYESLTGPGETTTPGALTQAGNFTIDGNAGVTGTFAVGGNASFSSTTTVDFLTIDNSVSAAVGGSASFNIAYGDTFLILSGGSELAEIGVSNGATNFARAKFQESPNGLTIETGGSLQDIDVSSAGSVNIGASDNVSLAAATAVQIQTDASAKLGFFGATPITPPSHTGITTVAQLVTVLQDYGLLS